MCVVCMYRFDTRKNLRAHVRDRHAADKEEIKQDKKKYEQQMKEDPENELHQYNYTVALLKLSALEILFPGRIAA